MHFSSDNYPTLTDVSLDTYVYLTGKTVQECIRFTNLSGESSDEESS